VSRILDGQAGSRAGAWTPGALFGPDLVTAAVPATVVPVDPATVWTTPASQP
jgi:short subunit dehydrogenase-like uncharacterized protein